MVPNGSAVVTAGSFHGLDNESSIGARFLRASVDREEKDEAVVVGIVSTGPPPPANRTGSDR